MRTRATLLDPVICLACFAQREDVGPCRRCSSEAYVYLSDLIRQIIELKPDQPARPTSIRALLDGE